MNGTSSHRTESDLLGSIPVPADALYGSQTQRAVRNFPLNGQRSLGDFPSMVRTLVLVKRAACTANRNAGLLDPDRARAISAACDRLIDPDRDEAIDLKEAFPVHHLHGGGGTSANMNANEVLANLAEESLGGRRGRYQRVHPNDHVNLNQSTNDVYPTACHIALILSWPDLEAAVVSLAESFDRKGDEYGDRKRIARTCLQDAVPVTVRDFLSGYAGFLRRASDRIRAAVRRLHSVPLGGTIVGDRSQVPASYQRHIIPALKEATGDEEYVQSDNLFDAAQNLDDMIEVSAGLDTAARGLVKTCKDLRLLSSGPECGFGEIALPPVQPGSSAMPGKTNPVVPEHALQLCLKIVGNHAACSSALDHAELDLNVWESTVVFSVLESFELLGSGVRALDDLCVSGMAIDPRRNEANTRTTIPRLTRLAQRYGYSRISEICRRYMGDVEALKRALNEEFPDNQ